MRHKDLQHRTGSKIRFDAVARRFRGVEDVVYRLGERFLKTGADPLAPHSNRVTRSVRLGLPGKYGDDGSIESGGHDMEITSRDNVLTRYRHLRALGIQTHSAIFRLVSKPALLAQAKRLGLAAGQTIVVEAEEHLSFLCDLTIHSVVPRRTRPIDRYARKLALEPRSEASDVLSAMQTARFSIWEIESRHELAGFIVRDLFRDDRLWLVDEGLDASATVGLVIASRLFTVADGFSMTCGIAIPLDQTAIAAVLENCDGFGRLAFEDATVDRRFAEALYIVEIELDALGEDLIEAA